MLLAGFLGWNQSKTPMFVSIVVINDSTELHIRNPKLSPYSYIVLIKESSNGKSATSEMEFSDLGMFTTKSNVNNNRTISNVNKISKTINLINSSNSLAFL